MKNLITLLFVVVSISLLAQSPQKFNYQAVVRNADGTVIKNQSVNFRMTIFEGSTTGLIKYQETQAGTTNKYGLISLAIGNGIISAGSMASINWGGNGHLLQVEIDPAGGTNFNILSTSQLMSVPYALYALSSGNGSSGGSDNDADSTNEIQTVSISNDTVFLSRGGFVVLPPGSSGINNDNDSTNEIQTVSISNDTVFLSRGGFAILPPGGGINNDNDSTNEIQTVSISNDTVFLSKGGFAILPPGGGINNDNDSTNEIQALTISNDTIYLARGGFVKLPATSGSVNNDNDSTNELIQTIIISNDSIVITEPNSINKLDISAYNQTGAVAGLNARIINDSLRLNGVNSSVTGFDSRITNDSVRLNGLESDVDTRIVNDSIRLNGVATNQAGFDTRITNDSVRLNGLESDVDTRIVNDSIRLNGSISKAVSDSNVIHSALSDTASAIRSDIKWQTNGTAINFMTGNVGIGVLAPVIKLDVSSGTTNNAIRGTANGTGENTAIFGNTPTTTGNNNRQYGIQGRAGSAAGVSGSGGHFGVHGEAYGAGNVSVGVSGYSAGKSTTGSSRGLSGFSESNVAVNNQGVFATARGSIGGSGHNAGLVTDVRGHSVTNYGVLNLTQANGTNNYGTANFSYWFLAGAAGTRNYGSYNWVSSADTNIGVFVDATITPADVNYGVWSKASGTNSLAGFFEGDVTITGDLDISGAISKGSGTFKIDHPLDPENKYLVHSFVESPDMMNVYNGNATTDANGIAIIELPQYIEASNKDFRYQLTPIGKFAQCIVKEEVKGDKFIIQTDKPNVKVSWQVTGIRNDPYAKQNRVIAEEEKSPRDKGSYLHPEVYGLDKSRSVHPKTKSKSKEEVLEMEKSK